MGATHSTKYEKGVDSGSETENLDEKVMRAETEEPETRNADSEAPQCSPRTLDLLPTDSITQVRSLTADDPGLKAREKEFVNYRAARLAGEAAPLLLEGGAVPTKTLMADDPTVPVRREAYLLRKKKREMPGKRSANCFLSNLPEVEADVQYRFTLVVMGPHASRLTKSACDSQIARTFPQMFAEPGHESNDEQEAKEPAAQVWSTTPTKGERPQRCLCRIGPAFVQATGKADRSKCAKLVFHPLAFDQKVPNCKNRLDALSTVVVVVLTVDGGSESPFEEQLLHVSLFIDKMRKETPPKLRPVRAILLVTASEDLAARGMVDEWAPCLADYEQEHGELWKFGPVGIDDGDSLHNIFAEIVSTRIEHHDIPGIAEHPQSAAPGTRGDDEAEEEEDDLEGVPEVEEEQDVRFAQVETFSTSESEGFQRPPIFEPECDGSSVGEEAIEAHTKVFGIADS